MRWRRAPGIVLVVLRILVPPALVAALVAGGNTEQLAGHLNRARENGVTEAEAKVITHLAFYAGAGWPRALSAVRVAREVFEK